MKTPDYSNIPPLRKPRSVPSDISTFAVGPTGRRQLSFEYPPIRHVPPTASTDPGQIDEKDENSQADHPFAIQVEITASSSSSKSWSADVTILEGKYQTEGDTQYTATQVTETFTSSGTIKPYVYLFIPLLPNGSGGWVAQNGAQILFGANRPIAVWPQVYQTLSGTGYATSVQIGAWTIQVANVSAGAPTYGYRTVINQIIAEDYVLTQIPLVTGGPPHAFKPSSPSGGNVTITSGYVNSIPVTGADGTTTWSVGGAAAKYWVKVTTGTDGIAISAEVERGTGAIPTDTATDGYQILFELAATTGLVTSQHVLSSLRHSRCGPTEHLFGPL